MKAFSLAALALATLPSLALAAPDARRQDEPASTAGAGRTTAAHRPARPVTHEGRQAADAGHHAKGRHHASRRPMLPAMHDKRTVARPARVPARLKRHAGAHTVSSVQQAERAGFKKVSALVNFPAFYPGLGVVYVKPDTLPVGPFRCFDRKGKLVASVYMLPIKDLDDQKRWDYVKGLPAPADHATFYYHPGHPGVPVPHYHFVIWHVPKAQEALVAR